MGTCGSYGKNTAWTKLPKGGLPFPLCGPSEDLWPVLEIQPLTALTNGRKKLICAQYAKVYDNDAALEVSCEILN